MDSSKSFLFFIACIVVLYDCASATNTTKNSRSFVDSVQAGKSFYSYKGNDPVLLTQHTKQSARNSALGGAGVAVGGGPTTGFLNPALLYASGSNQPGTVFEISYGRDSLFTQHLTTAGVSTRISPQLSIAGAYRYLRASDDFYHHDVTLTLAGRLFEESFNQGPVELGLNIRWERMTLSQILTESYAVHGSFERRDDEAILSPTDSLFGDPANFTTNENRFMLDLGFFQKKIADNLDFGVVLHNLLGYKFTQGSPVFKSQRVYVPEDTLSSQRHYIDTIGYVDSLVVETRNSREWLDGSYRRLTAGFLFHKQLVQNKALIQIPLDFEFLGLLDRSIKTHSILRTGAELWIRENYCLRFGYARAPMEYTKNFAAVSNHNHFSGGAGVNFEKIAIDLYIRGSQEWGVAARIGF